MTEEPDQPDEPDELGDRLRAADPAAGTPPPPDRWIAELTEAVMSTETPTRPPVPDRPRRRAWLVPAAAAAVLAVVGVGVLVVRPGDGPAPSAGSSPSVAPTSGPTSAPTVSVSQPALTPSFRVSAVPTGRCLAVTAKSLAMFPTAFEGRVTRLSRRTATLTVTHWWRAVPPDGEATQATVTGLSREVAELVDGVRLRVGQQYLITTTQEHEVTACGFSAAYSPRLARLYAAAFG